MYLLLVLILESWNFNKDNENELYFFRVIYMFLYILFYVFLFFNYFQKIKGLEIIMELVQGYVESEDLFGCRIQFFLYVDCFLF